MEIFIISAELPIPRETEKIVELLNIGGFTFHLRKPFATLKEIDNFIKNIPIQLHSNIVLHQYHSLSKKYNVKGLHLKEKERILMGEPGVDLFKASQPELTLSTSFHELNKITSIQPYDYIFLSPVYNSISKKGYNATLDLMNIKNWIIETKKTANTKIIALGGITSEKLFELKELGFDGAALLGSIWDSSFPDATLKQITQIAYQL